MTGTDGGQVRHRVPRATLVVMVLTVTVPVAVSALLGDYGFGYVFVVGPSARRPVGPPVLGLIGALLAALDRASTVPARVGWAIGAATLGVVTPWATWMLLILLLGP